MASAWPLRGTIPTRPWRPTRIVPSRANRSLAPTPADDFSRRLFSDFSFCVSPCCLNRYDLDLAEVSTQLRKSIHIELYRCVSVCVSLAKIDHTHKTACIFLFRTNITDVASVEDSDF
jgi:hypothetical protein